MLATDIETTCRTLVVGPGLAWYQVVSVTLCITLFFVEITTRSDRSLYRTKHLYQIIMTAQVHLSISTETRKLDSTELWLALFEVFKSRLQQLLTRGRSLNYAKLLHTRSSSGVKRVKSIRSIILLSVQPLLPSSCPSSPRYSGLLLPKPNLLWFDLDHYIYKCEPV